MPSLVFLSQLNLVLRSTSPSLSGSDESQPSKAAMDKIESNMQSRDTVTGTLPAACFDICNNANLEAQKQGKVSWLCDPGSAFSNYLQGCNACIDQFADDAASSGRQYIDNSLAPYLNYCNPNLTTPATSTQSLATIPLSWLTYHETFEPITASNFDIPGTTIAESTVVYRSIIITSTIPAYFFHISVQSLVSSYIPTAVFIDLAASAEAAASVASVTGDVTSLIYAALEDGSRPPWFSAAVPSTYTAEMSALEASINELRATPLSTTFVSTASDRAAPSGKTLVEDTVSPNSGNKAWIAGAVVGSVVGTALILLGIILFLRRQKLGARNHKHPDDQGHNAYMTGFKFELHAEPVQLPKPVYEMDASQNLSEMAVHEKPCELNADQVKTETGGQSSK